MTTAPLSVMVVDDEPLARSRLRRLLADCTAPAATVVAEAANAVDAMARLAHTEVDAVLLDIQMPGMDGLALAAALAQRARPPAVVFVSAHPQHALQAFEVAAVDYLTKPVRLDRLCQSLQKIERTIENRHWPEAKNVSETLLIQDRGRAERLPLAQVLCLKAELKYVTVRTAEKDYLLDASLNELEQRHAAHFLRVHRNALVARRALRALEKAPDNTDGEGEGWVVRLNGLDEALPVSRRQLAAVRDALR